MRCKKGETAAGETGAEAQQLHICRPCFFVPISQKRLFRWGKIVYDNKIRNVREDAWC